MTENWLEFHLGITAQMKYVSVKWNQIEYEFCSNFTQVLDTTRHVRNWMKRGIKLADKSSKRGSAFASAYLHRRKCEFTNWSSLEITTTVQFIAITLITR